jgi:hypothetical protein
MGRSYQRRAFRAAMHAIAAVNAIRATTATMTRGPFSGLVRVGTGRTAYARPADGSMGRGARLFGPRTSSCSRLLALEQGAESGVRAAVELSSRRVERRTAVLEGVSFEHEGTRE